MASNPKYLIIVKDKVSSVIKMAMLSPDLIGVEKRSWRRRWQSKVKNLEKKSESEVTRVRNRKSGFSRLVLKFCFRVNDSVLFRVIMVDWTVNCSLCDLYHRPVSI